MDVDLKEEGVGSIDEAVSPGAVISLQALVQEMMDRPLNGRSAPVAHIRQVEAQKMFAAKLFDEILRRLGNGDEVRVKNFGRFAPYVMPSETRSPRLGRVVSVKNPKRLRFYPSAKSVHLLNENKEGS